MKQSFPLLSTVTYETINKKKRNEEYKASKAKTPLLLTIVLSKKIQ